MPIAARMLRALAPFCDRIEVAGSVRRQAPDVSDVELVVIPRMRRPPHTPGLFHDVATCPIGQPIDCLHERLNQALEAGTVRKRLNKNGHVSAWGEGLKYLSWTVGGVGDVKVDLFRALPTTWGTVLCLRTGPEAFSKLLVTQRAKGGWCPNDLQFDDGALWRWPGDGQARRFVPTPEEEDVFREMGLPYVRPEDRTATTYRRARVRVRG